MKRAGRVLGPLLALMALVSCNRALAPGATRTAPEDAVIELPTPDLAPDEMRCAYSGPGAGFSVAGERVSFDCSAGDGSERVLLGGFTPAGDGWTAHEAVLFGEGDTIQIAERTDRPVLAVELADATRCDAADGAPGPLAVGGARVAFLCRASPGTPAVADTGHVLVGDIRETAEGFVLQEVDMSASTEPKAQAAVLEAVVVTHP